ncbi:MAG: hypothetical protein M3Z46_00195 [Actinomycetota bacterium]|nr:hypothetical protein [Actinomycetota bacterium]
MNQPLNNQLTLVTYETAGGERAFLRYELLTVQKELPGFSSAVVDRHLTEVVLVTASDAAVVQWLLTTRGLDGTLADLLDGQGVSFRCPASLSTSSAASLPSVSNKPLRFMPGARTSRSDLPAAA